MLHRSLTSAHCFLFRLCNTTDSPVSLTKRVCLLSRSGEVSSLTSGGNRSDLYPFPCGRFSLLSSRASLSGWGGDSVPAVETSAPVWGKRDSGLAAARPPPGRPVARARRAERKKTRHSTIKIDASTEHTRRIAKRHMQYAHVKNNRHENRVKKTHDARAMGAD